MLAQPRVDHQPVLPMSTACSAATSAEMAYLRVSVRNESTETGNPVCGKLLQDRGKPPSFLCDRDRCRVRVAGGGTQLNDVGACGSQVAGVRDRGCGPR